MAVAAAVAAGAAVAAAGSIAGGMMSAQGAKDAASIYANMPIYQYNPLSDPLLAAASQEGLLGLGQYNPTISAQANPGAQLASKARELGLDRKNKGTLQAINYFLQTGKTDYPDRTARNGMAKAMQAMGYTDSGTLWNDIQRYNTETAAAEARNAPVRAAVAEGRNTAYMNLAALAKDFPTATKEEILALAQQYEDQIRTGIGRDVRDQSDQILQSANMMRGNPAATLGRLREAELVEKQKAPTTALERAIMLLQGQSNLGTAAIAAYQNLLDPAQRYALNVAALRTQAMQNAVSGTAQQQQVSTAGQAENTRIAAESMGNGIAGGAAALGSGISGAGTLGAGGVGGGGGLANYGGAYTLGSLAPRGPGSDQRYTGPYDPRFIS